MVTEVSKNGEKPTFSRFLVDGVNTEHLRIPDNFLKHISRELSERAILKLKDSSESSWTVKVMMKKPKGSVFFKEGWEEFLEDNSLRDRDFLIFTYDGKMHFSIQIFEKNGCNRDVFTKTGSPQNSTLPDTTTRPRGRPRKHPASCSKLLRPLNSRKNDSVDELSSSDPSCEIIEIKEVEEHYEDDTSEDSEAAESEYTKSNFPDFIGVVRKAHSQFVPRAFSRKHFPQGEYFESILKNAEGKKWSVNAVPGNESHFLCAGWHAFASANRISIRDTCKFELLGK